MIADGDGGVGLIPATSPPGPVVSSGRTVLRWTASPFGSSAVTGNGQDIYYCVPGKASKIGVYPVNDVVLRAYHVATAATRTLATYQAGNDCQLAISGQDLLIGINRDGGGGGHAFTYDLKKGLSSPFPHGSCWDQLVAW